MRAIRIAFCTLWLSLTSMSNATGQGLPPGWDFAITPLFHPIAIPLSANPSLFGDPISPGDYIGVFFLRNDSLICAGASEWYGSENIAVVAFGDDNMTIQKDGFQVNETINWKIYSWIYEEDFIASATYDSAMPNYDGKFHPGGLSALTGLYYGEPLEVSARASPDTVCIGSSVQLSVSATGGSGSCSFSWFSVPEGFSSDEQNPVVIPLQTTHYIAVVCDGYHSLSDTATVTVVLPPQVQAGNDTLICENGLVSLEGTASDFRRIGWLTDGDGHFADSAMLITSYLPGPSDLEEGMVKLTLKAWANPPCLESASDFLYVTIAPLPVVNAGEDGDACAGESFTLSGYAAQCASVQWFTSGDGSFDNPFYIGATYYPGTGDLQTFEVSLILSGYPFSPCTMIIHDTMTLILHSPPEVSAGIDHWISYGTSTQLNGTVTGGSGEYLFTWEPAEYLEDPAEEDPITLNLYQSTVFTLTATDAQTTCSELDTAIVYVTGGPLSVTASANPDTLCTGSMSQLMALPGGGSGNYTYQWTSDPPGFSSDQQNPVVYPDQTTTYTVMVDDGFNAASDQAAVYIISVPEAHAGDDQSIPYGTGTVLQGSVAGGSGHYSWQWSPAQYLVNPQTEDPVTVNLTELVEFVLTVTDLMTQCTDEDSVNVNVVGGPLQVSVTATPDEVCAGESSQLRAEAAGGSGSYAYMWTSDPPGFFSDLAGPFVTPGSTTGYFVQVTDGFTAVAGYATVVVFPVPVVEIESFPDDTVCAGETVLLDASVPGGVEYYWLPDGQSGPVIEVDSAGTGFGSTTYTVYVTALDGCTGVDSVEVTFVDCVGIQEEQPDEIRVWFFPNPATERITIQFQDGLLSSDYSPAGMYRLTITDITGRALLKSNLSTCEFNHSVSVGSFQPGIYIVVVRKDDRVLSRGKVVVW